MRREWPRVPGVDLAWALGLYLGALWIRLQLWHSPIYGDEGHMFLTARTLGGRVSNVFYLMSEDTFSLAPLFWYRPLSHLPLYPGALISFDAWRLNHIVLTSFTPVVAYAILRILGVRRWLAGGAGAAIAFNTVFVAYGTLVFHDGLGTLAFGLALWARVRGRHYLSAVLFVAAAWVEEIAMFGLAYLLARDIWKGMRLGESSVWPLRLNREQTAYACALLLTPAMLLFSLVIGGRFPGHGNPAGFPLMVDRLFYLLWFAPLVILGLRWQRSNEIAGLGLVYPVFYMVYYSIGRSVQLWWMLLPAFLAVIAASFTLETWMTKDPPPVKQRTWVPKAVAGALAALVLVHLLVPSDAEWKGRATLPLSGHHEWNIEQTLHYHDTRDRNLGEVMVRLNETQLSAVFLVDVHWYFVYTPFAFRSDVVRHGYTWLGYGMEPELWVQAIDASRVTVLLKTESDLNHALLETYEDCKVFENGEYVLFDTPRCPGRTDELVAAYEAKQSD